jgi:hypothetical protein
LLGTFITGMVMLAFTTPWLLPKIPVRQPPDPYPLVVWLVWSGAFVLASALQGLLWVAVCGAILNGIIGVWAYWTASSASVAGAPAPAAAQESAS